MQQAKEKNIIRKDNMTKEYCFELLKKDCFYCLKNDPNCINGIDRMDNQKCYEKNNCVSCCKACNFIKGCLDPLTFLYRCQHIHHFQMNGVMLNKYAWKNMNRDSYSAYKHRAYKHKPVLEFKLDENKFFEICDDPCYYCNKSNSNKHSNGIDRKNNKVGYIESNCVSCCRECNQMKSDLSDSQFIEFCKNVSENIKNINIKELEYIPRCYNRIEKRKHFTL